MEEWKGGRVEEWKDGRVDDRFRQMGTRITGLQDFSRIRGRLSSSGEA